MLGIAILVGALVGLVLAVATLRVQRRRRDERMSADVRRRRVDDLQARWERLCDKLDEVGYERLSAPERLWVDVRSLIDSIENGGLISYFYNSGADNLDQCRAGLRKLGAVEVLAQVDRVAELFGNAVPKSLRARNRVISSWPDDAAHEEILDDADEVLMPLMSDLEEKLVDHLRSAGMLPVSDQ